MASSPASSPTRSAASSSRPTTPATSTPNPSTRLTSNPSPSTHRPSLLSISLARGKASASSSVVPQVKRSISARSALAVENDIDAEAVFQLSPRGDKGKQKATDPTAESLPSDNLHVQDYAVGAEVGEDDEPGVGEADDDNADEHDNESVAHPSEHDSDPRIMLREQLRRSDSARPAVARVRRESYKSIPPDLLSRGLSTYYNISYIKTYDSKKKQTVP